MADACSRCEGSSPRQTVCASCHTAAVSEGGQSNGERVAVRERFEYCYVRFINEADGIQRAALELADLASRGWRLLPMVLPGSWGIMERDATVTGA